MSSGHGGGAKKHVHEEHEEHVNHESWVIPYADMLTLLMALFLVMFAMGRTDIDKFEAVAESFRSEFGGSTQIVSLGGTGASGPFDGGMGILDGGLIEILPPMMRSMVDREDDDDDDDEAVVEDENPADPDDPDAPLTDAELDAALDQRAYGLAEDSMRELDALREMVQGGADQGGIGEALGFRLEARGLVVSIVTDQVLFADGNADMPANGAAVLDIVATSLLSIPNRISIEGHSDSRPISTARFPSNWELSSARAASVLRYFVDRHAMAPERLTAAGYADTKPVAVGDSAEDRARNRRVEIVVLSSVSLDPLFSAARPSTDG